MNKIIKKLQKELKKNPELQVFKVTEKEYKELSKVDVIIRKEDGFPIDKIYGIKLSIIKKNG